MYHPYLHVEAKRIVKQRRQAAAMLRRAELGLDDRPDLLTRIRARLGLLMRRPTVQHSARSRIARSTAFDAQKPAVAEE